MGYKINLVNGNIITLDKSCPIADTISLENGKIAGINAIDNNHKMSSKTVHIFDDLLEP